MSSDSYSYESDGSSSADVPQQAPLSAPKVTEFTATLDRSQGQALGITVNQREEKH